jgi:multicomponent Na+:H+ antiporter subunit G
MIEQLRVAAILGTLVLGLFFTLVSTVGVLRLPDIYARAHTASQADTLGAGFALAGVALSLGLSSTTVKTVLLLFFIFVTNPTAAHAIARAAHEEGIEPWTTDDDQTDRDLYAASQETVVDVPEEESGPGDEQPGTPATGSMDGEDVGGSDSAGDGGEPA